MAAYARGSGPQDDAESMGYPSIQQDDDDDDDDDNDNEEERLKAQQNRYFVPPNTVGTGFRYLQRQMDDHSKTKPLLKRLLQDAGLTDPEYFRSRKRRHNAQLPLKTVDSTLSDETILQLARQVPSQMSLLASLLKVLHDDDGGTVSTRAFLKTCALTVRPGLTPACMDAKEMVLAALHFLSTCEAKMGLCHNPPWIRPVQSLGDLEKRVYEKVGSWTCEEIWPAVAELEDIFYASGPELQFLPRTRFCPTLIPNQVEHDLLLLKGNPPVSTIKKVARKKKATVSRRNTTQSAGASAAAAAAAATTRSTGSTHHVAKSEEDPLALEATRIMTETTKGTASPGEGELA